MRLSPGRSMNIAAHQLRHERIVGRKVRVLALHGAPANSNVMKFQTAPLRRLLGEDVEWVVPDAKYNFTPTDGAGTALDQRFKQERTPFEERIGRGKPFVSWFKLLAARAAPQHELVTSDVISDPESFEGSISQITEVLEQEGPIDVVVAFSQGVIVASNVAHRLRKVGKPIPWRLSLFFSCTAPCPCDMFEPPLSVPTFFVTSPQYVEHTFGVSAFSELYSDIVFLEHEDGFSFPTSQPRAQEIYERLAAEFWKRCTGETKRGAWAAWCTGEVGQEEASAGSSEDEAPKEACSVEVAALVPATLAGLLQTGACLVADTRTRAEARSCPFPGAEGDVSFLRLQMAPREAGQDLAPLRDDGRRVVVVSVDGERCKEYCSLLVSKFGFRTDQVCRLDGGLQRWRVWEAQNKVAANEIRKAHGMPTTGMAEAHGIAPGDLAALLGTRLCVVADARQPAEMRGRPFFGVQRDISFYLAQRRPQEVRRSLEALQQQTPPLPLVVVSLAGDRCREYCALLLGNFGLSAEHVLRLDGGICAWDAWEEENAALGDELRLAYGLPDRRS